MSRIFNAGIGPLPDLASTVSANTAAFRNRLSKATEAVRGVSAEQASGVMGGALKGIFYLALGIFILFVVLLAIHFFVTPIFRLNPDDPGFVQVPTVSDAMTAWTSAPPAAADAAGIQTALSCGYTVAMDVYDMGLFQQSRAPRVLLYRANAPVTLPVDYTGAALQDKFSQSNIVVYLDHVTNDLTVGAITQTDPAGPYSLETTAPIQNTPVKTPFRLTVVFTNNLLEVYRNGQLVATKALAGNVIQSTYDFYPPINQISGTDILPSPIKVGNLYVWNRVLSVGEIRADGKPISPERFFRGD